MVGGLLAVTPGPNMVYVMARSVSQGTRAGLISLAGVMLGYLSYMFGAAFGISALFLAIPGAARLLTLLRQRLFALHGVADPAPRRPFPAPGGAGGCAADTQAAGDGAVTSLLNPKLAPVFISVLPQFIDYQAGDVLRQSLTLDWRSRPPASVNACVAIASGGAATAMAGPGLSPPSAGSLACCWLAWA